MMNRTFILVSLIVVLFIAGCSQLAAAPGVTAPDPTITSTFQASSTPVPDLTPTSTSTPIPIPSLTPTVVVDVYNLYIGRDATRQPELIKTPPAPILSVREAKGYTGSYIAIFLQGKQVNGDDIRGNAEMLAHLIQLFEAARKANHSAQTVLSSYRSYESQAYLGDQPSEDTDASVAPPGRSEHQLGTAVDLAWNTERLNFYLMNQIPAARAFYNWLKDHAHEYGFVFSYPYKSNADQTQNNILTPFVTEFKAEPWHIRYVGIELAEKIYAAKDDQGRNYLDPQSTLIPQIYLIP